ncbi:hypothetical protein DYU11_11580 [Fibrisoma montanum]|uniref:Uncharacterized protein n=1 Tax=Fibrisoma montanum TaxID=2305895 RepID=A0A418MB67_9BACT|nr:hypothetical protein [Fibrisoma montanum]RIV23615.1 hypothetical protein DYU11_11580 [Fibrisoma montanum]
MTGSQLFQRYLNQLSADDASTREQAGIVMTAASLVPLSDLYQLLEEADRTGKRLELVMPTVAGPAHPTEVRLVAA